MPNDRRRTSGRRSVERRRGIRNRLSKTGVALGLVAMVIILYQLWYLLQG